jgi:hypothetical protein
MTSRGIVFGMASVIIVSVVIGGTVGAYYFTQYSTERTANDSLILGLNDSATRYGQLASNFNDLLSSYNRTLSLLSRAIAVLNTSQPVYQEGSRQLSTLWQKYLALKPTSASLYKNDVLFDFGNGTRVWYNDTAVQPGWNVYVESVVVTKGGLAAQWYPQYGEHLVTGIQGVMNTQTRYWFLWTYSAASSWQKAQVGADQLTALNGSTYAWTFCDATPAFEPMCRP